jgi:RimJ/RimL family protein N-acetyltransferase
VIETERLVLRPLEMRDAEALASIYADEETMRFLGGKTLSLEDTRTQIACMQALHEELGYSLLATIERETGELVGRCGLLLQHVDGRAETEVAYAIARPHWRRGFGTEAARAVTRFAREERGMGRLVSIISRGNVGSIGVATKNGMRRERDTMFRGFDVHLYASDR